MSDILFLAMRRIPTLVGVEGHFKGESCPLLYGKTVIVGRSRDVDFSLKRTRVYCDQTPEQRDADEEAQTISGRHFKITVYNLRSIEIKNLSPNGTIVDGKPIESIVLSDVSNNRHEIRMGLREILSLEMREHEEGADTDIELVE